MALFVSSASPAQSRLSARRTLLRPRTLRHRRASSRSSSPWSGQTAGQPSVQPPAGGDCWCQSETPRAPHLVGPRRTVVLCRSGADGEKAGEDSRGGLADFALGRRTVLLSSLPCGCLACSAAAPRNQWRDSFFANAMNTGMGEYEELLRPVKAPLFDRVLKADARPQTVVELGIGTAPNLKYYPTDQDINIVGVDPNAAMAPFAYDTASRLGYPENNFSVVEGVAEKLPLPDDSVDVVVGTLVLCSVPDVPAALAEVRRVLKPGGKYVFIEHVAAPSGTFIRAMQTVFNPLQIALADGCHLTRDTAASIQSANFQQVELDHFVVPELSIIGPHIAGVATA